VTTASQVFADDGQQKFRYAVGSFGAEPRHRVANGRAREALDQIVLVVVEVYTRGPVSVTVRETIWTFGSAILSMTAPGSSEARRY
jgi:hypothetical protein